MLVISSDFLKIDGLIQSLKSIFRIKDVGLLSNFLGVQADRSS